MTTKPSPEEIKRILKIIVEIETSGGSSGYKNDPGLFQEFADEVSKCKTEEDLVINCLEDIKASNDTNDSIKKVELLEARAASHKDKRFRALLPKFQFLKSNMQDLHAYESLIKDLRILSEFRKDVSKGVNQRVLETIEAMEALGGSVGFKKHVSEMQALATHRIETSNIETTSDVDLSYNCWGTLDIYFIIFIAFTSVSCTHVRGAGTVWGIGLDAQLLWGWLNHAPPSQMDGIETNMQYYGGAIGVGPGAAWFRKKSNDDLMAQFTGEGIGLGAGIGLTGDVGWEKK